MKAPAFDYAAPPSLDEALALLARHGDDAAVLAGGQSLLLQLRYRERRPGLLVDVNRVAGLGTTSVQDGVLRLGALVRHAALDGGSLPAAGPLGRLLREVTPYVAHPPIRARGTFVGSLAWAHPAAEWCAVARLADARLRLRSSSGAREVGAEQWFRGRLVTDRRPDELVEAVDLPLLAGGTGTGFVEHRRSHASFALVAAAAAVRLDDAGTVEQVRVAVANAAPVPLRDAAAEQRLAGRRPDAEACRQLADDLAEAAQPWDEPHCSAQYRRHATRVVVERALLAAADDARRQQRTDATAGAA